MTLALLTGGPGWGAERRTPAAQGMERMRRTMIERDIAGRGITNPAVLRAMEEVPREEFVPASCRAEAYDDNPLPIGMGQTISQPYIVALMTELAEVKPGHVVLEVGTGSGYQAAVLARMGARVFTVEILPALADSARERLRRLGFDGVEVRAGDGYAGWPEHAPFDAVLVTAAPECVPPPLLRQLKPGGRLVIPVGPAGGAQELQRLVKDADGRVIEETILPVRFVPLTGRHGEKNDDGEP